MTFLTECEAEQVASAIDAAERRTAGEIKVVVTRHCWTSLERKAAQIIEQHGLDQTAERAAVLILIVAANRELIIRGDTGIHAEVGQEFWDDVRDVMVDAFSQGAYARGMCDGIELIADRLAAAFPAGETTRNELSNEIAYAD
ncbi:MAG: hypothetical protein GY725_15530 [bacterium]|nr:hypothetical protein [bacterium]